MIRYVQPGWHNVPVTCTIIISGSSSRSTDEVQVVQRSRGGPEDRPRSGEGSGEAPDAGPTGYPLLGRGSGPILRVLDSVLTVSGETWLSTVLSSPLSQEATGNCCTISTRATMASFASSSGSRSPGCQWWLR